jgi:hypothetical protein
VIKSRNPHSEVAVKDLQTGEVTVVAKAWAEHLRWFWALHFPSKSGRRSKNLRTDNRAATLEEAKAQFQKSWDEWKEWAKMEEVP